MATALDVILVVDVESTCWEGKPPPGETSEIIEVGLCPLEVATGRRLERRGLLVAPQMSTISPFCTQLTTITAAMLEGAGTLKDASRVLQTEYDAKRRVWASWGDYDRRQFERNCKQLGMGYPFGTTHINVKNLFALAFGLDRGVGMARALEIAGMPLDGTHHRSEDDAWNIAGLLALVLGRMRA